MSEVQEEVQLGPAELVFLLEDMLRKLEFSLTSAPVRRAPFLKVRIAKMYHLKCQQSMNGTGTFTAPLTLNEIFLCFRESLIKAWASLIYNREAPRTSQPSVSSSYLPCVHTWRTVTTISRSDSRHSHTHRERDLNSQLGLISLKFQTYFSDENVCVCDSL